MTALLDTTLEHLRWLVGFDTTNPPRRPAPLVEKLASVLRDAGLAVSVEDHGDGCLSVLATRGAAKVVMNAHVDTVPVAPSWTRKPFELAIEGDRVYGLGACDVKGGAAAMIAAATATRAPVALLFTTDEEAGSATCMRRFVATEPRYDLAIVAEPTNARAVVAHRGVATGMIRFEGRAGHSSVRGSRSAVHDMVSWATDALALAAELEDAGREPLTGVRFNLGRVEGGEKPNVVAAEALARFGVRPPPDLDPPEVLRRFAALAPEATFEQRFFGPPLPRDQALGARAAAHAARLGLGSGQAVDFWTEASILSAAGIPAIVLGPGDIKEAHGPDEHVTLAELEAAALAYAGVLEAEGK